MNANEDLVIRSSFIHIFIDSLINFYSNFFGPFLPEKGRKP
jgi:hypothetical protein